METIKCKYLNLVLPSIKNLIFYSSFISFFSRSQRQGNIAIVNDFRNRPYNIIYSSVRMSDTM